MVRVVLVKGDHITHLQQEEDGNPHMITNNPLQGHLIFSRPTRNSDQKRTPLAKYHISR